MAVTIDNSAPVASEIRAKLNYHLDGGPEVYQLGTGSDMSRNEYDVADVRIKNLRGHESEFTLDEHGFQLLQDIGRIESSEPSYLREKFYATIVPKILAASGASEVVVASHVIRPNRVVRPQEQDTMPIKYAQRIHVDYSYDGARVNFLAKCPQFAERFENSRWAVINWWQPFQNSATRMPLALCDARSVADEDYREIMTSRVIQKSFPGSAHMAELPDFASWKVVKPQNPDAHKWYFAPDMQPDEALLIKIFDTSEDGVVRRTPHSAFESPLDHGPERTSIEFRCVAFWDDEPVNGSKH
ncbi:Hypothetical predicted protein [Lecanosticta acicola]|uniref:Uncharacterized protein n=1 Tax=Lecanosticta acicola TaxID=111012 RepID=A0AAI9ECX0_9PEZI|nr:Hypothetical predicted protein [Lecanosticta acicola]